MVALLFDDDVNARVSMQEAIVALELALREKAAGKFQTPPRHYAPLGAGMLVFTVGGSDRGGVAGFRVYGAGTLANDDAQFVAVLDAATGDMRGIVFGTRVGAMRTGALGGIAIKHAARADASTVAVIGSGVQARTQLEAAAVVRPLRAVRVYSRSAEKRELFTREMGEQLTLPVQPVASPEEAIRGADIVLTATNSQTPVFDASLIEPGMHVTTIRLGKGQHELDLAVGDRADAIFTDSPEQLRAYPGGFFLDDLLENVTDLADSVARNRPVRSAPEDVTLYCSAGLSGTEVLVAELALRAEHP